MILIQTLLKHWIIKLFIAVSLLVIGTIVYDYGCCLFGEIIICFGLGLLIWFMTETVDKIIEDIRKSKIN